MSLTKHQRQLLVSGYIRAIEPYINRKNEVIVNEQCYSFYEEILEWLITGETLNQFVHAFPNRPIISPPIQYHDIHFNYTIYTNDDHYITILFRLCSKPNDIISIGTCCSIYLESTLILQQSVIFNLDSNSHPLVTSAAISEFVDYESLTFSMFIEIMNVKYHPQNEAQQFDSGKYLDYHAKYIKNIKVKPYSKYEWKLDDFILRTIRNTDNKRFYSENVQHDNIWCMSMQSNASQCLLMLTLIKLPHYVYTMNIECKLTVRFDDTQRESSTVFTIKNIGFNHVKNIAFRHLNQWSDIKKSITALTFVWEVCVLQMVDVCGNIIFNDDTQQFRFLNETMNC